jgi:hypothetical protein
LLNNITPHSGYICTIEKVTRCLIMIQVILKLIRIVNVMVKFQTMYINRYSYIGINLNRLFLLLFESILKATTIICYIFGIILLLFGLYNLSISIPTTAYIIEGSEGVMLSLIVIGFGIVVIIIGYRAK